MTEFRQFLMQPRRLAAELSRIHAKLEDQTFTSQGMVASYSGMGGFGGSGDAKDGALAAVADLVEVEKRCWNELSQAESDLEYFLDCMKQDARIAYPRRDVLILWYRYLLRLDWTETRNCMAAKGYKSKTERTIYNWHKTALLDGAALWRETRIDNRND